MAAAPEDLHEVPEVHIRPMLEMDLTAVAAIEQKSYAFPWSEGIFRDCLRVGYTSARSISPGRSQVMAS